jgi:MoaA/NifB/PqqE/SkfB family radical SAM enzyme
VPRLISVKGPHARHGDQNSIRIQWNMGNSCNYSCVYCPDILHDGSKPWLPLETYLAVVDKFCNHYKNKNKRVEFELIGGEVTVIPGFEKIVKQMHTHGSRCTIFTNGSRTVEWWSKAKQYIDNVVLTFHPLTQDPSHFESVINEIKEDVDISINVAGVGNHVDELGVWVEQIRDLFKDCNRNRYYNVSICVKTMYKKLLGRHSKQETFYEYSDSELDILRKPGIKPRPIEPLPQESVEKHQNLPQESVEPVVDTSTMTEFLYEDGTAKYVQNHQIINEGLNSFKGMNCHIGFESLTIDAAGDIYSSWCGAVNFGNVRNVEELQLPEQYVDCPFDYCNNISDIAISKSL